MIHSNIEILLKRLDWFSQKSSVMSQKTILERSGSHVFLHISGMLIQLLALPRLYHVTLAFKR